MSPLVRASQYGERTRRRIVTPLAERIALLRTKVT